MYIRPSEILKYEDCPRSWYFQYEHKIRPLTAAALEFGTAVHGACAGWLQAGCEGRAFDPVEAFRKTWTEITETRPLAYNSVMGPEDLAATGEALCAGFPGVWAAQGLTPIGANLRHKGLKMM